MFYQIVSFLLEVVCSLLTGACLLRLYMQWQRVPFGNQAGQLVFALTNWLVLPLRRAIPAVRGVDVASVLAAFLVQLVQYLVLWALLGGAVGVLWILWMALFGLLRVAIGAVMVLLIIHAVMSWVQARSPLLGIVERLAEPLLRPVRRVMPTLGGIDFSPLVLIVLLQVALMVLANVQASVWR